MALKSNKTKKLSKTQIQKDRKLLNKFLFDLIDDLYKDLKTITRLFHHIGNNDQKGNFIFNFDLLTKQELVNIILESIIETALKCRDSSIRVDDFGSMVEKKLCNTKYIVSESKFGSHKELSCTNFARMIPSVFSKELCNKLIDLAHIDTYSEECSVYHEILKEDYYSKPIMIELSTVKFKEGEFYTYCDDYSPAITFQYISFLAFKGKSKTRRTIRIEDLSINSL